MAKGKTTIIQADAPSNPRALTITGLRCGSCNHYKRVAHFSDVCSKLGVKSFTKPCPSFSVSPAEIDFGVNNSGLHLSRLMRNASTKDLLVMAAVMRGEALTRKHGFYMGQPVIIKLFQPGTHMNHFAQARVVWANAKNVQLQGIDGFTATMLHDSIITVEKFAPMKAAMIEAGRIACPKIEKLLGLSAKAPANGVRDLSAVRRTDGKTGQVEGKLSKMRPAHDEDEGDFRTIQIGGIVKAKNEKSAKGKKPAAKKAPAKKPAKAAKVTRTRAKSKPRIIKATRARKLA